MSDYKVDCTCGIIEVEMKGPPKVAGFCHCEDCRELLSVPYHSVDAWEKTQVEIKSGKEHITEYQHPRLSMKKYMCSTCGDILFNSNGMDWRVFSQNFIRRSLGKLPPELKSKSHFFYGRRIIDVADDLPKRD